MSQSRTVTPPTSGSCEEGSVSVVVVAVVGLSAAGKSTAAHSLAHHLHSPFHPIPLDDFFTGDECERLGTFEDYRTIDFSRFVREVQALKRLLLHLCPHACSDEWKQEVRRQLPSFEKYIVPDSEADTDEGEENRRSSANAAMGGQEGGGGGNDDNDDSLTAHEWEETLLRAQSTALRVTRRDCQTDIHRCQCGHIPRGRVLYLVCEGFCLFSSPAVVAARLFDACVWVQCPMEVACRRRFQRTPRRHRSAAAGQASPYKARIELLWRMRTIDRRKDLCQQVRRLMLPWVSGVEPSDAGDHGRVDEEAADGALDLLIAAEPDKDLFRPPGKGEPFWDVDSGAASDRFIAFWQSFQRSQRTVGQPPQTCTGVDTASPAGNNVHALFIDAAAADFPEANTSVATPSECPARSSNQPEEDEGALRRRYAEFRYWFYFEVVFYFCLFLPIQRAHCRHCFHGRGHGRGCGSEAGVDSDHHLSGEDDDNPCVFSIDNSDSVTKEALQLRAASVAKKIASLSITDGSTHTPQ